MEIEKILVNLITDYMDLPANYGTDSAGNEIPCVCIANQNIKLFNTTHLQITVQTLSNQLYSNRRYYFTEQDENQQNHFYERVCINEQKQMQIDCYSRNNEARQRYNEVQMALNSTKAEELQDKYQFKIGIISNVNNLSGMDGGSEINRFTIRFNCLVGSEKVKEINYYDTFRTTVQEDKDNNKLIADFTVKVEE